MKAADIFFSADFALDYNFEIYKDLAKLKVHCDVFHSMRISMDSLDMKRMWFY